MLHVSRGGGRGFPVFTSSRAAVFPVCLTLLDNISVCANILILTFLRALNERCDEGPIWGFREQREWCR